MWHVGIDLHRRTVVVAAVSDSGDVQSPRTLECQNPAAILDYFRQLGPFRAVIEATGSYRWLYDLLAPRGSVLLAHPSRLSAMVQRRSKTDKLDALLLAHLLRINQIPTAYVPPTVYQQLRDLTRWRARLQRESTCVKLQLHALLARHNLHPPYRKLFGPRGLAWWRRQDFGFTGNLHRDDLLARIEYHQRQIATYDERLAEVAQQFPEVDALLPLPGIGVYTALLVIAELGEVHRFRTAKQVGAYTGLTSVVRQSGGHCYRGSISRQGSPWLRWILVEAAIKAVRKDDALQNFYTRVRKRSGKKKARVAVARKLAEICWKRLIAWHGTPVPEAA